MARLTEEQRDEVLDAIEDRIERLTLLIDDIGDGDAIPEWRANIATLEAARRSLSDPEDERG